MIKGLLDLIYPNLCLGCNKPLFEGEIVICTMCRLDLPRVDCRLVNDNVVEKIFRGRFQTNGCFSLLSFEKHNTVAKLIHQLKYKNRQDVGIFLGGWLGYELSKHDVFKTVNSCIPMPISNSRRRTRGYNQAEILAKSVGEIIQKPIDTESVIRKSGKSTQTKKTHFARWENVASDFAVQKPINIANKHILIIDDVVTTGASLEALASELTKVEGVQISIATVGYTKFN